MISNCSVIGGKLVADSSYPERIGGIAGRNMGGVIEDCYSTGNISGNHVVGGLVGLQESDIKRSYAAGPVTANTNEIGGLVGTYLSGITNDSFWDKDATGVSELEDNSGQGTPKTTAEMQNITTFNDTSTEGLDSPWDIVRIEDYVDQTWFIGEAPAYQQGQDYPRQRMIDSTIEHTLTVNSTSDGTVTDPGEGTFTYDHGTTVNLKAEPNANYHFVEWTGDTVDISDPYSANTTIDMNNNYSITANFALDQHDLTVDSTSDGTVTDPGEGTFTYGHGTVVNLEAVSDEGYHFVEWTGDNGTIGDVTANQTTIEMLGNYTITAEFAINTYTLNISSTAGGNVTVPGEGTNEYDHGAIVNLEAKPDLDRSFVRWTGDNGTIANTTANQTTIQMLDDYTITAVFDVETYNLTIDSTSGGHVTMPGEGTFTYSRGKVVNLAAEPIGYNHFVEWRGDNETIGDPKADSTTITIEGDYTITAEFTGPDYFEFTHIEDQILNESFEITVTAYDEYGRLAENYRGRASLMEQTGTIEPSETENFTTGSWTGNVTITESYQGLNITAEDGEMTGNSNHFNVSEVELEIISPEEGEIFDTSEVTIEWYSNDTNHHEVRLDNGSWENVGGETEYQFTGLEDGPHTAEIKVVFADDQEKIEMVNFLVDTTPPDLNIISPENGEIIYTGQIMVEWECVDEVSGIDHNEIRLGTQGWEDVGSDESHTFENLESGNYTIEIRTADEVGHLTTENTSFKARVLSIEILSPGEGEIVNTSEVEVEWESEYAELHQISVDGGNWSDVGGETSHTFDLEDGEHTVEVRARDEVGNYANSNVTFVVDHSQPELTIRSPDDGELLNKTTVLVEWNGTDDPSGIDNYEVWLGENMVYEGSSESYSIQNLGVGGYEIEVIAFDLAGNRKSDTKNIMIDTVKPMINIYSPGEDDVLHTDRVEIEWTGDDNGSGIASQDIRLDDGEWISVDPSSASYTFEDLDLGEHTVEIQVEDEAGNRRTEQLNYRIELPDPSIIVHSMNVDDERGKAPYEVVVEAEVENVAFLERTVSILVDGEELQTVTIDPESDKKITFNHTFEEPGEHEIKIVEESRTVTVEESSMSSALSGFWWVFTLLGLILVIPIILLWRRREEEEEGEGLPELQPPKEGSKFVEESSRPVEEEMEEAEEEIPPPPTSSMVKEPEETEGDTAMEETKEVEEEPMLEKEKVSSEGTGGGIEGLSLSDEVEGIKECPECGEPVEMGEETCLHCGAELEETPSTEDEIFHECEECGGFMITFEKDKCPYCDAPIDKNTSDQKESES
ncbi:MAG: GLUG motif-containing protein [Candidatus Thermoplasmatota archaeon]